MLNLISFLSNWASLTRPWWWTSAILLHIPRPVEIINTHLLRIERQKFSESAIVQRYFCLRKNWKTPHFYRMFFILPVILLYLLSPFVFMLPVESGEKVSTAITILLAQVVSMGALADILPESSTTFPLLIYFLAISVVQMALNTVLSIIG